MIRQVFLLLFIMCQLTFVGISQRQLSNDANGFSFDNLLIPRDEIFHGGPPKDGIPSIDNPKFIPASKDEKNRNNDYVLGINYKSIVRAFPIRILDRHEIVNTEFGNIPVAITYCPLCGSGIAFSALIDGKKKTFGVSGLIYNSDVLVYDRETESLWSQIMMMAVSGKESGRKLELIPMERTTWGEWKRRFPESFILSDETGFNRNYDRVAYERYKTSKQLMFPVNKKSRKYSNKDLVLGIHMDDSMKAYPFKKLNKIKNWPLIDQIDGKEVHIYYNKQSKSARITDSTEKALPGVTMYWFAWYAFNPSTLIWE